MGRQGRNLDAESNSTVPDWSQSTPCDEKIELNRRGPAFQAVGGDTEVSENRLPLTPLFAFASRHCCPATPAKKGSIRSAYVVFPIPN